MSIDLKVPEVGESIKEVLIVNWLKAEGDAVARDEAIAVIETDKATLEVPSPATGAVTKLLKKQGEWAKVGEVIAQIAEAAAGAASKKSAPAAESKPAAKAEAPPAPKPAPAAEAPRVMPAAARVIAQEGLAADAIQATGPGGRILKEDAQRAAEAKSAPAAPAPTPQAAPRPAPAGGEDEIIPMTPLRRTIAKRLVEAQQSAALLTTFNEIDMSGAMALRKQHGEAFLKRHGAKLGFMSFFVKASVEALKAVPSVNAEIRGTDIVYKNRYDVGIAVGGGKGLVVPVLRGADRMSFAEVEKAIGDFGARAQANKIGLEELQGGTFTISNGGIYGSLLSTPIINPPQSGILGLHAIQDRPVAREGQVVIRPMMYVALTYDHRLVDGREAVTFLKRIKEILEDPARMLLEI